MVTQHTRDVLAATGKANPVEAAPSLGRWLKSQLPGGEKAMGVKQLGRALTSPAMVRDVYKAAASIVGGGAPVGMYVANRRQGDQAVERILATPRRVAKAVASGDPVGKVIPGEAGRLVRKTVADAGELLGVANPVKAPDKGEEKKITPEGVPQAWYPDPGMSWTEEPGGRYLSARYARQFGTWGHTFAGEGWRALASRGGWDSHLHPAYTQTSLRWIDRPGAFRVGARTYTEL